MKLDQELVFGVNLCATLEVSLASLNMNTCLGTLEKCGVDRFRSSVHCGKVFVIRLFTD